MKQKAKELIEAFRSDAEDLIQEGKVGEMDFAGPTYQIEVDGEWPFFQFDATGKLKDYFCSCDADENCAHLSAALLKIFDGKEDPLHIRFERSLWNVLGELFSDALGYEDELLKKKSEHHYQAFDRDKNLRFELKGDEKIAQLFEERGRETEETSLKFSNLPEEEIERWRAGRASPSLRYLLSFWNDLARLMMILQEKGEALQITFEEEAGLPTHLHLKGKGLEMTFHLDEKMLIRVIPSLGTVDTPLKLHRSSQETIQAITYDPKQKAFLIEHGVGEERVGGAKEIQIDGWLYVAGDGFYSSDGHSFLSGEKIKKEEIPQLLSDKREEISPYLKGTKIHEGKKTLQYEIAFDHQWNLHLSPYLFEKGDLSGGEAAFFDSWVFHPAQGFYPISGEIFEKQIPEKEVSNFINTHKIWLGTQAGFNTHLASIESNLAYRVDEHEKLHFYASAATNDEAIDAHDFGDWIYYEGQGFFSKQPERLGLVIRPGVEVAQKDVSSFIKKHREELETLTAFFATTLPLKSRGVKVWLKSETEIEITPIEEVLPAYKEKPPRIFGDFAYVEGEGFSELPAKMRLPEKFRKQVTISEQFISYFLSYEMEKLKGHITTLDPRLHAPLKFDLQVLYLARLADGGMKAQLFYITEQGKVPVTEIIDALRQKKRYLFSDAGLIDLQGEILHWLRHLSGEIDLETEMIQLSTLELMRLESTEGLLSPPESAPAAQITRNLLRELREFLAPERPELKGLRSELRLYQQTGLHWLWFLYRNGLSGLLCDDMGLGKTHQAMALIASSINWDKRKKRFLVVCPTSVIYHWEDKLAEFLPNLKVHTFHGQGRSLKRLPAECVVLTSYGICRMEKKKLKELGFEIAVYDEIQIAKNAQSRVHEALRYINAKMSLGLTGTPIENTLRELKALFDIVLPGYMPTDAQFRDYFVNPIEKENDEERMALLRSLVKPFILRRKKQDVLQELPEKSEEKSHCGLSSEQIKLYQETLESSRERLIADLQDDKASVPFIHIFSLLSKLKQICNHPALLAKDAKKFADYTSGKWELFVELMDEARESDQKVVVFSQYLTMLDIIENYVKEKGWGYAQIRGDTMDRREELRRFQEDPDCVVFIGSLQAAGLGIDLTSASIVILYDRWWNAARENQAIDRVHRIGQKLGVQVFKLITKGTIEEKIDRMITKKGRLMEEIVTADDQAALKKFTRGELIDLLTFVPYDTDFPE